MKKPREYISFSSYIEDKRYFTQVDLKGKVIFITSEGEKVWVGTIDEFKNLEKIKANKADRVYKSLLDMAEELYMESLREEFVPLETEN